MYNSYDIVLSRRTIYIDYRHFSGLAWTNEQLIDTIKTAIYDDLLPVIKYDINDVLAAYKALFGENEPLLQVYKINHTNMNNPNLVYPNNIIEVVPLKGNQKISGGVAWRSWVDRMTGTPDYYVIRISDQCRDVIEAAILLYNELEKSKLSVPMQLRILAKNDVDLYWGMTKEIYEQQVVPAIQKFVQQCKPVLLLLMNQQTGQLQLTRQLKQKIQHA
jgi:hypothetical protein